MNNQADKIMTEIISFGNKLRQYKSNVKAFAFILIIAFVLSAAVFYFFQGIAPKLVIIALFLSIGSMHVLILAGNLSVLNGFQKFIYTAIIALFIFCIGLGFFVFVKQYSFTVVLSAMFAFVLPFCIVKMWHLFQSFSTSEPIVWYYTTDLPHQKSTTFLNSMPVRFAIHSNVIAENISFRAPVKMKLGLLFYHVVQERNSKSSTELELETNKKSQGWIFYTTGFGGIIKYLDPEVGLVENGVRQNAIVRAQQLASNKVLANN